MQTPESQAVERLRRVFSGGECPVDVYREAFPNSPGWGNGKWLDGKHVEEDLIAADYETLADAYLSLHPPGDRPVPMEDGLFGLLNGHVVTLTAGRYAKGTYFLEDVFEDDGGMSPYHGKR